MKRLLKKSNFLSLKSLSLTMALILFGLIGMTTQVHAHRNAVSDQMDLNMQMQTTPEIVLVSFQDNNPTLYTDLSGNAIGEGVLGGELLCVGEICNQKIAFEPILTESTANTLVYQYKFKSLTAFDPQAERVVVSGTGTIFNDGLKTKFSFTGVFENNGDGTVHVTFQASTPDASFIFSAVPGTFTIFNSN